MTAPGRPLRVVVAEHLPSGGLFQFSFHLGEALARAGHEVVLLTGPAPELRSTLPEFVVAEAVPTWHPTASSRLPRPLHRARRAWRALLLLESWRRTLSYVRRTRPDVLQVGELRFVLDSAAVALIARLVRRHTAVVDVAHNPLPYDVDSADGVEKSGRLTLRSLDAAYRACGLVLTLGEGPRQQLLDHFPGVREVVVCGHGEYGAFAGPEAPTPAGDVPPRLLFFGSWTRYKNLPLLLDAFALVRERCPGAELVVAGPVMADVDLPALQRRAAGLPGVDLRPGYVAIEDLPGLFGSARVVALPYEVVNISGVVHLAHTFARPVVATDVGAMRDVVHDGVTGLLAGSDPTAFADALVRLLADPAACTRMGAAGHEVVTGDSSWQKVAGTVADAYGRLARR